MELSTELKDKTSALLRLNKICEDCEQILSQVYKVMPRMNGVPEEELNAYGTLSEFAKKFRERMIELRAYEYDLKLEAKEQLEWETRNKESKTKCEG